jgi:hypothetical protein
MLLSLRAEKNLSPAQLPLSKVLTRAEFKFFHDSRIELFSGLPVILLAVLPFVGYALPLFIYRFPHLLPLSFWSPEQIVI